MNLRRSSWIKQVVEYWVVIAFCVSCIGVVCVYAYKFEELEARVSKSEEAMDVMSKALVSIDKSLSVLVERVDWLCKQNAGIGERSK